MNKTYKARLISWRENKDVHFANTGLSNYRISYYEKERCYRLTYYNFCEMNTGCKLFYSVDEAKEWAQDTHYPDQIKKYLHVEISTIDSITAWFKTIKPKPANKSVQFGAMCEEFGEILRACGIRDERLEQIRDKFYHAKRPPFERTIDDVELLDAICDTIVTLVGFGYMMGYDVHGALNEVNASNWSKFENGEPVFNEHGKIAKGENYRPPELEKFV